jgi:hypothetical protein
MAKNDEEGAGPPGKKWVAAMERRAPTSSFFVDMSENDRGVQAPRFFCGGASTALTTSPL